MKKKTLGYFKFLSRMGVSPVLDQPLDQSPVLKRGFSISDENQEILRKKKLN